MVNLDAHARQVFEGPPHDRVVINSGGKLTKVSEQDERESWIGSTLLAP